ncbi:hypothetical protein CPB85DRAFT_1339166, partial [Mucidula mucida]
TPSTAAIYEWAVRMMYEYCVKRDLREVWAYLWENWYDGSLGAMGAVDVS